MNADVYQYDGKWWHRNECDGEEGPFDSEGQASRELAVYAADLDGGPQEALKVLRRQREDAHETIFALNESMRDLGVAVQVAALDVDDAHRFRTLAEEDVESTRDELERVKEQRDTLIDLLGRRR